MKIFYIDPMSYNNLSKYDRELLNNIKIKSKYYYCNYKLEFDNFTNTKINRVFRYSEKHPVLKGLSYIFSSLRVLVDVFKVRPDIIHYQWFKIPTFDYLILKIIKYTLNSKIVYTGHNILPHDTGNKYKMIYKKIYNTVDAIIVHTKKSQEELISNLKIKNENVFVIPHGLIDLGEASNHKLINIKSDKSKINFLFFGHLNLYKGVDLLIDAWRTSENLNKSSEVRLIIAGKGKVDFKGIESFENVTIINRFLGEDELYTIIKNADVIVMPYRKISQSGVLLSVLIERKALIVTDVGGLTEPFTFGDVGWVLKDISKDSLITVLEEAIRSKEKIKLIHSSDELWSQIKAYYDWDSIGKKTEDLYQNLVE